jgi:hypothetical protein
MGGKIMNRILRYCAAAILGAATWAAITHTHSSVARADSDYTLPSATAKFVIRSAVIGTVFQTVRLDTTTGDTYYASSGKWAKYTEDTAPGAGVYDLQLMAMPDGKSYNLIRADLSTGRAWYIAGTKWSLITEQ